MRTITLWLSSLLLVAWLASACGGKKQNALHVVGYAPTDAVDDERAPLRISFDRPVVDAKQVGAARAETLIEVSPKITLKAHWQDRQTLVAIPATAWQKSTRYHVKLEDALQDRMNETFGFSFVHDPLDVVAVTGVDRRWVPPQPSFGLSFDQKVRAKDVPKQCTLTTDKGKTSVGLSTPKPDDVATQVALTTQKALTQGKSYTLRCEGLEPAQGDAALLKPYESALDVYPALALNQANPSGTRVTPDDLTIALTFSTPVSPDELRKHVHVTPKLNAKREWLERTDTVRELSASLEADETYTVKIDGALTDRFGQKLGEAREFSFVTTDAAPWLSMENGIYAIEASAKGYPVWSRNVEAYDLNCASISKAKIVSVLGAGIDFNNWAYGGKISKLDFKPLGLKPKTQRVATGSKKNKWQRSELDLPARCGTAGQRGAFLAEVTSAAVEAQRKTQDGVYPFRVLGNVTNLGVLLKVGPSSGLVWVTSLTDGKPVAGAAITLYEPTGKKVFAGASDARGLLMIPGSAKLVSKPSLTQEELAEYDEEGGDYADTYKDQRLIAIVEKDDDWAFVDGNWSDGMDAWNFGLETDRSGGTVAVRGFIESDRGIYRPGETVHVKGLLREVPMAGDPRVPSAKKVRVRVEDGQGAELLDKQVALTEFGGFSFNLPLEAEARTGDYYVIAKLGEKSLRQSFSVEEIRPVTFEINALGALTDMRMNSKAKLGIEARYLFGAPVTEANVHYEVQRRRRWISFEGYEGLSFEDWYDGDWDPWWSPDHYEELLSEGDGTTDKHGKFELSFHDEVEGKNETYDYLVRASVRDAADQEVTKRLSIRAHRSDMYIGVGSDSWVTTAGKPFTVRVAAVDTQGKPIDSDAKVTIARVERHCASGDGPYGYWSCERERKELSTRPIKIGKGQPFSLQLTADEAGEHLVRVEARDQKGVIVRASTSIWVYGEGNSYWAYDDSVRMSLIPSKLKFAPGETATLVPEADTRGATMLVTTERDGVLEARIQASEEGSAIQVPLQEAAAPNLFVSVAMVKPRTGPKDLERPQLKLGMVNLPVSFGQRALNVEIETLKQDYKPGEIISGKVRVRGQDGAPVHAEIALSAADEGVLQLINYQTPNPMDSIYAASGLGVQSATNWTHIAALQNKPQDAGEEGADGAGAQNDAVRSRFLASAFWAPALVTDAQGEAVFSFPAPDNLTAFRLMAAVADIGARFGASERRVRVRKEVLIAPVVPRFLLADDQIELGAVIHNYTDSAGEVEAELDIQGVTPRKKTVKVRVDSQGKAVVRVPVKVLPASKARYLVRATLRDAGGKVLGDDAMEISLPIERAVVKSAETVLTGRAASASATLEWQKAVDPKASALTIMVDRTGLADMGPSLAYLVHYPYGCLEQTMSGLMPLLKVRDLATSLDLPELRGDKLDAYIKLGTAKIVRHQHPDGHFSLWPDSETYPHLTVYAMWGLNEAKRAGVAVDKRALTLGATAIQGWANDKERTFAPGDETATIAMAAFVLSELNAADPALNARLFAARSALPVYGKALLARAMSRSKASAADLQTLVSDISSAVKVNGDVAEVPDPLSKDAHYFSSESRTMAMVVAALLELAPKISLVEPLVTGLKKRRSGGRWGSTQENVYGLLAIASYARAQSAGKVSVQVKAGDQSVLASDLEGSAMARVRIPLDKLTRGNVLSVTASEPVYYNLLLDKVVPEPQAGAVSHGFTVTREYRDLKSGGVVSEVKVGDLVRVGINVKTADSRWYVAVSDPLPSGFEPVNEKLATEREVSESDRYGWYYDYRALRDERTDWFIDSLHTNDLHIEYTMRATHAGVFTVPPTHAHEMYAEQTMGHSASNVLTVSR